MGTSALLAIARGMIANVLFYFAISSRASGEPYARVISRSRLREDWSVGLITTGSAARWRAGSPFGVRSGAPSARLCPVGGC
jgi:hypothetical protein